MTFDERIQKLKETSQGWLNTSDMASIQGKLKELDGWLRNRLRYCIWHHWKKPERKRKNLIRLGVEPDQCLYHGAEHEWEDGQLPKVRFLVLLLPWNVYRKRGYEAMLHVLRENCSTS